MSRLRAAHAWADVVRDRLILGYLAVLMVVVAERITDPASDRMLLGAWVVAGAIGLSADAVLRLDRARRVRLHQTSGLPSVAGWRLADGFAGIDPERLLAIDLTLYLHDSVALARRPIRGRRRRSRTTYEVPLRELARAWARERGLPVRRGDRVLEGLVLDGVVHRVTVGQVAAFRLVDHDSTSALARQEHAAGCRLVAWHLGRDPEWHRMESPGRSRPA